MKINHIIFTLASALLLTVPVMAQDSAAQSNEPVTVAVTTEEATQAEMVAGEDLEEEIAEMNK